MGLKRFLITAILLFPGILFSQKYDQSTIDKFIDQWHRDAANVDMEAYFDKIAEDGIFIGTDETEVWTKQAFYEWSKPHFDKGKTWDFKAYERNIYFSKDKKQAWFDEKLKTSSIPLRGSGVLILDKKGIRIKHYVLSVMVPNEKYSKVADIIGE